MVGTEEAMARSQRWVQANLTDRLLAHVLHQELKHFDLIEIGRQEEIGRDHPLQIVGIQTQEIDHLDADRGHRLEEIVAL